MKGKRVSIMGCGWLGMKLAETLTQSDAIVHVSTGSNSKYETLKENWGEQAFQLGVYHDRVEGAVQLFLESELLIVNITPNRGEKEFEQFAAFIPFLEQSAVQQVLFVSSTSVYPMLNRVVREDEGVEQKEHPLYKSEQLFLSNPHFETTVVRLSGLIGGQRHPGRFFAKSGCIKNSEAPVNLIHRQDCIQVILAIIEQEAWGETFNACASSHPSKAVFYSKAAASIGLEILPCEIALTPAFKEICNNKIKKILGVQLKYDNLMDLLETEKWV